MVSSSMVEMSKKSTFFIIMNPKYYKMCIKYSKPVLALSLRVLANPDSSRDNNNVYILEGT
jgi:hypothetical protein